MKYFILGLIATAFLNTQGAADGCGEKCGQFTAMFDEWSGPILPCRNQKKFHSWSDGSFQAPCEAGGDADNECNSEFKSIKKVYNETWKCDSTNKPVVDGLVEISSHQHFDCLVAIDECK